MTKGILTGQRNDFAGVQLAGGAEGAFEDHQLVGRQSGLDSGQPGVGIGGIG